ncbi:hypothetical protein L9F63_010859, partial [Diploptera punctata]
YVWNSVQTTEDRDGLIRCITSDFFNSLPIYNHSTKICQWSLSNLRQMRNTVFLYCCPEDCIFFFLLSTRFIDKLQNCSLEEKGHEVRQLGKNVFSYSQFYEKKLILFIHSNQKNCYICDVNNVLIEYTVTRKNFILQNSLKSYIQCIVTIFKKRYCFSNPIRFPIAILKLYQ